MGIFAAAAFLVTTSIQPSALSYLERFEQTWSSVQTLEYVLLKTERLRDGTVTKEKALVKFAKPGRFYIGALEPRVGQEILYDPAKRGGKLLVHPGRFPDLTLSLDIHGSLATAGQHHVVSHGGYAYLLEQLRSMLRSLKSGQLEGSLVDGGPIQTQGGLGRKIIVRLKPGTPKRVKAGSESLFEFARRVGMDPYRILMENPQIDGLSDKLEPGSFYLVPLHYGSRLELVFNEENGLLVRQRVWEPAETLYEDYSFTSIRINPELGAQAFDEKNTAYDF